jgi:serine/threonine protein kinase
MSPEQATGDLDIDGRSDIYSLGVLGFYMLTGSLPFDGSTFEALAARHIVDAPPSLEGAGPAGLCAIIERCLAKNRDDRFRTGEELAEALDALEVRKRWFSKHAARSSWLFGGRAAIALAMLAGLARAAARWTTI